MRQESGLGDYLQWIGREPLLCRQEEARLARCARQGDRNARNELVRKNLRFVVRIAKSYQNRGLPFVDLIQEGNLGLLRAAERFDERRGARFVSYAAWWIRKMITSAIARQGAAIRIPAEARQQMASLARSRAGSRHALGREPTAAELASGLGLKTRRVQELLDAEHRFVPLDASPGGVGPLRERLGGDDPDPIEAIEWARIRTALSGALDELPARERVIVRRYYGFEGEGETLRDIGDDMGVTRERVRQLRNRSVERVRRTLEGRL